MKKTNYESGRSMVEMLGALVIIGVLSIGGIVGYSYGMDKYRANTTMNDVNVRAIDLMVQINHGGNLSLSEWPTKSTAGYDIGLEVDETMSTTGGIEVLKVPQDVCKIIADDLLPENIKLVIDGEAYVPSKCGETNNMIFYYDAIMGSNGNEGEECNGVMVNDVCTSCPENTTLSADKTACLCANGGPVNFDTGECLTPCEEAFYNAFLMGESTDVIKADGTTAIFNIPADGTETTLTVVSDVNASHCKLKIESGQSIILDLNSHRVLVDKLSVDGMMTLVDNSDMSQDGTGTGNLMMYNASLSNAGFYMQSGKITNTSRFAVSKTNITMNGGSLKSGSIALTDSSTLKMNDGIIEASSMSCSDTDSVTITGGTFDVSNMSCPNVEDYR